MKTNEVQIKADYTPKESSFSCPKILYHGVNKPLDSEIIKIEGLKYGCLSEGVSYLPTYGWQENSEYHIFTVIIAKNVENIEKNILRLEGNKIINIISPISPENLELYSTKLEKKEFESAEFSIADFGNKTYSLEELSTDDKIKTIIFGEKSTNSKKRLDYLKKVSEKKIEQITKNDYISILKSCIERKKNAMNQVLEKIALDYNL